MIFLLLTYLLSPFIYLLYFFKSKKNNRILIIQTAKIGDFVSTTPVIGKIKKNYPLVELVVLVHENCKPIAKNLKGIDRVISLPKRGYKGFFSKVILFRQLFLKFDSVIILSPNLANFIISFAAIIPLRISILHKNTAATLKMASYFLTYIEQHDERQRYQISALKSLIGIGISFKEKELIKNFFPLVLHKFNSKVIADAKYVVGIGISSGNKFKSLSSDQIVQICSKLMTIKNLVIVLVGLSVDIFIANKICKLFPKNRVVNSAGKIPLQELGSFVGNFNCFVGVDSGATYIADAVGVPVVDFMGPASSKEQRPIGPKAVILDSREPCAPCSTTFAAPNSCHLGTRACIKNMDPELIFQSVKKIIFK